MKLSVRKYREIAEVGDEIITNATDNHPLLLGQYIIGKVNEVKSNYFSIKVIEAHGIPRYNSDWVVNWNNVDSWVEVISSPTTQKEKSLEKSKRPKKKIYVTITRDEKGVTISLKVPPEIEDYYKTISKGETQESGAWFLSDGHGATFYKLSTALQQAEKRIDSTTFSDFGNGLTEGDYINTALLRVVGISKGVNVRSSHFSQLNNLDIEFYSKRLGEFTKHLWEASISKRTIKSIITYEI